MREKVREEIYVTGTVRANRKGLPSSINEKQTVKNSLVAVRNEQLLSISWMDINQVRMLSTSSTVTMKHVRSLILLLIITKEWVGGGGWCISKIR